KFTNALARTHSAYLLQHAHNPVDWYPWDDAVLERAAASNKLLIISIGYASCHWCHVMEKEVYDNQEVALYMNAHFLAIKVDREERPDIDQVYMEALQVLTQSGGWPLNIVALPDGRPLWGCTYLPKQEWLQSLQKIYALQKENPQRLFDYGEQLMQQLSLELTPTKNNSKSIDLELLQKKLLLNHETKTILFFNSGPKPWKKLLWEVSTTW
ncbi:MAG: thioredoxin domain-containing protein, partial [Flavobacteriia bacterium]|nr:thioredoxin domain-containing protein [Flavobacteriia bacterium]